MSKLQRAVLTLTALPVLFATPADPRPRFEEYPVHDVLAAYDVAQTYHRAHHECCLQGRWCETETLRAWLQSEGCTAQDAVDFIRRHAGRVVKPL